MKNKILKNIHAFQIHVIWQLQKIFILKALVANLGIYLKCTLTISKIESNTHQYLIKQFHFKDINKIVTNETYCKWKMYYSSTPTMKLLEIPQNNNMKVLHLAIKRCNNLVQFMWKYKLLLITTYFVYFSSFFICTIVIGVLHGFQNIMISCQKLWISFHANFWLNRTWFMNRLIMCSFQ
jgi:hypothetical protein